VKVQDRVALPEPVTLVGLTLQDVLLVKRLVVPVKPLRPVIVMVDVPAEAATTVIEVGLALNRKSWTTKLIVTECEREELVPVTLTWTVPYDRKVHDSVEAPDPVTLVGDVAQEVLLVARLTVPAKPLSALTVTVEVPAEPALTFTVVGLAATL
jgi:hypothetical protein